MAGEVFTKIAKGCDYAYTLYKGNNDVIYSYHIYASCFPAMMWDKLCEIFVIVTSIS